MRPKTHPSHSHSSRVQQENQHLVHGRPHYARPPAAGPHPSWPVNYQARPPELVVHGESDAPADYLVEEHAPVPLEPERPRTPRRTSWKRIGPSAKRGFRTIEQGYSRFRTLYGGVVFGATMLFTLAKMNNVREVIMQVKDECDHADVIVEQVDAALSSADGLHAGRAGRVLWQKLERVRNGLVRVIDDLRDRIEKYDRESLGFTDKGLFYINDSQKITGLRKRLREHLDTLQDLAVWLNRLDREMR